MVKPVTAANADETTQGPEHAQSLFSLMTQLLTILEVVDEAGGEISADQLEALDGIAESITVKAEVYSAVTHKLDVEAAACDRMAEPYLARAARKRMKSGLLKGRLQAALELAGMTEAIGPTGGARLQTGKPAVKLLVPDDDVPDRFCERGKRLISRVRIAEAIAAGEDVPFARLEKTPHLRWVR
jgi:Siphovirus Gp157